MSSDQQGQHQIYLRVTEDNLVEMEFRRKTEGMSGGVIYSKGKLEGPHPKNIQCLPMNEAHFTLVYFPSQPVFSAYPNPLDHQFLAFCAIYSLAETNFIFS